MFSHSRNSELHKFIKTPTRFSFNDGKISNICPSQGDNIQSLNFKRGFLSAFQASMEDLTTKTQVVKEVSKLTKFQIYSSLSLLF